MRPGDVRAVRFCCHARGTLPTAADGHGRPPRRQTQTTCGLRCRTVQALVTRRLRPCTMCITRGRAECANRVTPASVNICCAMQEGAAAVLLSAVHALHYRQWGGAAVSLAASATGRQTLCLEGAPNPDALASPQCSSTSSHLRVGIRDMIPTLPHDDSRSGQACAQQAARAAHLQGRSAALEPLPRLLDLPNLCCQQSQAVVQVGRVQPLRL